MNENNTVNNVENNVENKVAPFKRDMVMHRRSSVRVCKNCGKFFVMSDNDIIYYVNKFNSIPLKCEACREKSRNNSENENSIDNI